MVSTGARVTDVLPTRWGCPIGKLAVTPIPAPVGWNPLWLAYLAPVVLLNLPHPRGALHPVARPSASILDWPVLPSRGRFDRLWIAVVVRTMDLVLVAVDAWRTARRKSSAPRAGGSG